MDSQKFKIILDSLLKSSEEGNLEWKMTGNQYTYLLALKDSAISIERIGNYITLAFRDEKGNIVDEMTLAYPEQYNTEARRLYELARRKATNADETIDRILKQLSSDSMAA